MEGFELVAEFEGYVNRTACRSAAAASIEVSIASKVTLSGATLRSELENSSATRPAESGRPTWKILARPASKALERFPILSSI